MKDQDRIPKSPPCGNEVFGCRNRVFWQEWVRDLRACKSCVRNAARWWCVAPGDLGLVLTAFQAAKSMLGGERPTQAQVWPILRRAGVQKVYPVPEAPQHAPADSALPAGDRAAA